MSQALAPERERNLGDDKADHEGSEPHVDKTLQRAEPERPLPVAPDPHDTMQVDCDTSLQGPVTDSACDPAGCRWRPPAGSWAEPLTLYE